VPGTSIGTEEAEEYIKLREQGQGRRRASKMFCCEKVMRRKWMNKEQEEKKAQEIMDFRYSIIA